jgi:D-alanine-D-alanine ligase
MVTNDDSGWKCIEKQVEQFGTMIVEERIHGRELTAGVIGHEDEPIALPLVEISPKAREFYDYRAKYTEGETQYICPATVEDAVTRRIQEYALTIYVELSLEPYARIDCILDGQGAPWFLEANTLPGFTPLSLLPRAAAAAGIGFAELLELLMLIALERHEHQRGESA